MTPTWDELSKLRWGDGGDETGIIIEPRHPLPTVERMREILAPESTPKPRMRRAPQRTEAQKEN